MGEIASIWVAGAAIFVLVALAAGAFLRLTRTGKTVELSFGELMSVLAVIVVASCAVLTAMALLL